MAGQLLSVANVGELLPLPATRPEAWNLHADADSAGAETLSQPNCHSGRLPHWSIEKRCHWVRDVTFGGDHCQVLDKNAAHNPSILRECDESPPNSACAKNVAAHPSIILPARPAGLPLPLSRAPTPYANYSSITQLKVVYNLQRMTGRPWWKL